MSTERWQSKAGAFVEGWRRVFGVNPTLHAVILGLAMAQHETQCGDSWKLEFDWGATTLRSLTTPERKVLADAGLIPTVGPGHDEVAAKAQAALVAAGLAPPNGVIHCDSTTDANGQHPYFVFFFKGEDDADGARYFIHLLAEGKPAKAVLENPSATERDLAAAAYARSYFWGFKPHQHYRTAGPDGVVGTSDDIDHDGNTENIDAYANALRALTPGIRAALAGWQPSSGSIPIAPPPVQPYAVNTPQGQWRALLTLGCVRPETLPYSSQHYLAALGAFQCGNVNAAGEPLAIDGDAGAETQAALRAALTELGLPVA